MDSLPGTPRPHRLSVRQNGGSSSNDRPDNEFYRSDDHLHGRLGVAAFLAFLIRTPLNLALVDARRDRWLERSRMALGSRSLSWSGWQQWLHRRVDVGVVMARPGRHRCTTGGGSCGSTCAAAVAASYRNCAVGSGSLLWPR